MVDSFFAPHLYFFDSSARFLDTSDTSISGSGGNEMDRRDDDFKERKKDGVKMK